jgi:hypothetical protein
MKASTMGFFTSASDRGKSPKIVQIVPGKCVKARSLRVGTEFMPDELNAGVKVGKAQLAVFLDGRPWVVEIVPV